ncbi:MULTISPECIES: muconolactone Delta-isomerase family protein [Acidobacteriaceae]|uniref:muconolactone Delta-isomerase family protein n=1 Tax=Acidobacteriaceae TaxID=204434 RepID=UPI00131C5719|nr:MULTISPECIES: muconolactone Delta-isomerase family protein [Acidobacteriaceae]MDW5267866.1 muconolactone Delta-isomerase family protein [Edaphobacter sp.]
MQFLVLTRRKTELFPAEAWTAKLLASESQRVRELYAEGTVRSIWRRKDMPGAAILLEAATEDEARAAVSSLPLAKQGMLEIAALTELEPYPGFGPR